MAGRSVNWCLISIVGFFILLGFLKRLEVVNYIKLGHTVRTDLAGSLVSCILDTDGRTHWESLVERTKICVPLFSVIDESNFEQFHMGRYGEVKVFLPLNPEYQGNCYQVTIGIGGDTQVEKEFHQYYPRCQIFGIEPAEDQASDFDTIGTVIPVAVGIEKGRLPMTLRRSDGGYFTKEIDIVPLPDLLTQYVGTKLIHFATIDIEGFDYNLLDAFKYQQPYDLAEVVFCQIDVELHGKAKQQSDFDFEKFLPSFLADSPYVPVFATSFLGAHIKLTLIHTENIECEEAFTFSKYFP